MHTAVELQPTQIMNSEYKEDPSFPPPGEKFDVPEFIKYTNIEQKEENLTPGTVIRATSERGIGNERELDLALVMREYESHLIVMACHTDATEVRIVQKSDLGNEYTIVGRCEDKPPLAEGMFLLARSEVRFPRGTVIKLLDWDVGYSYDLKTKTETGRLTNIKPNRYYLTDDYLALTEEHLENLREGREYDEPFDPEKYASRMASVIGFNLYEMPVEIKEQVFAAKNKLEVNKIIFPYLGTLAKDGVTDQDASLFENIMRIDNAAKITALETTASRLRGTATTKQREANEYLMEAKLKLDEALSLKAMTSYDIVPEVREVLKDNWYTLDRQFMAEHNATCKEKDNVIAFLTPEIFLVYENRSAGIDSSVNLGRFRVIYQPNRARIHVLPYMNNVFCQGSYHPHVSTDGDPCWGNAAAVYSEAMGKIKPSIALTALRTLLQTYNPESPYRTIESYEEERDEQAPDNMAACYVLSEDKAVVERGFFNEYVHSDEGDEEGDGHYLIKTYRRCHPETKAIIAEEHRYMLGARGFYVPLDEADVIEWI